MQLVIGNKLYSSWSMRPWLMMTVMGLDFEETVIPMSRPETRATMLRYGPTGKVPVLIDGEVTVWESLAILEYLADRFPDKRVWPAAIAARAHARCAASEMHAGFTGLRTTCPMNLGKRFKPKDRGEQCAADVIRIEALWAEARQRFGAGGDFLYGAFSAADAMFAPVVTRLDTYQIQVRPETRAYMDSVLALPAFRTWLGQALSETWRMEHYEAGETAVDVFLPAAG